MVDCEWVQGYGYRPIRVDVRSPAPAKDTYTLAIELGMGSDWSANSGVSTSFEIELPAGSKSASKIVRLPQLASPEHRIRIETSLNGAPVEELTGTISINNANNWLEIPRMLFVGASVPDVSEFAFLGIAAAPYSTRIDFTQLSNVPTFVHRMPQDLTDKWIDYSVLDITFVSLADARDLASNRPEVWQALTDWARCGGTLCIFGVGGDWHGLAEVETLTQIPEDQQAKDKYRGWQTPTRESFEDEAVPAIEMAARVARETQSAVGASQPSFSVPANLQMPAEAPFAWNALLLGQVVALADDNPFPGDSLRWQWLITSVVPPRRLWTSRYGTVPDHGNFHFNEFLIADVGLPPIRAYQVLISVFVVAIGPLNYWLLRRRGRLHLFLFTVPLAAIAASGALLGYTLLADGLASHLRARSFTLLDQRAGQAAHVARLSYYMGLAPRRGLTFPEDTMVAPLELTPNANNYRDRARLFSWNAGQHLTRGWISSRMPTQYVTARTQESRRGLDVAMSTDGAQCAVRNRLGTRIRSLILCDPGGNYHHTGSFPDGERATLTALKNEQALEEALTKFSLDLSKHAPELPEAMLGSTSPDDVGTFFFGRRYYGQEAAILPDDSLLEHGLAETRAAVRSRSLGPRTYVAIVDRPQEIVTGVDGLVETQSLHVILGTW
ncbi:MAG: hypothetical protein DWQ37_18900 [Planctomycetota bacterium]|nr:MAG: hypothetical protein DWQ37_18900 [Planctomycetota bacterium]